MSKIARHPNYWNNIQPEEKFLRGVSSAGAKFTAQVSANNKTIQLGTFATEHEAYLAYLTAAACILCAYSTAIRQLGE